MASGESEGNHVLLAVAAPLAEFLDTLSKSLEEFDVVHHAGLLLLPDQKHHEQISCLCSLVSVLFLHSEKLGLSGGGGMDGTKRQYESKTPAASSLRHDEAGCWRG